MGHGRRIPPGDYARGHRRPGKGTEAPMKTERRPQHPFRPARRGRSQRGPGQPTEDPEAATFLRVPPAGLPAGDDGAIRSRIPRGTLGKPTQPPMNGTRARSRNGYDSPAPAVRRHGVTGTQQIHSRRVRTGSRARNTARTTALNWQEREGVPASIDLNPYSWPRYSGDHQQEATKIIASPTGCPQKAHVCGFTLAMTGSRPGERAIGSPDAASPESTLI